MIFENLDDKQSDYGVWKQAFDFNCTNVLHSSVLESGLKIKNGKKSYKKDNKGNIIIIQT